MSEEENIIKELMKKQESIKKLEEKYGVIGVSFAVREGAKVPIDEAMDYVANQIEESAKLIKHKKSFINHGRTIPE
jgi:hypothetical protein